MTVSRLENELSGPTELIETAAFLSMWPAGEEALDLRFESLLKTIDDWGNRLDYAIRGAAGTKPSKPRFNPFESFRIFKRLDRKKKLSKKYFDEMTPEEINKVMRQNTAIMIGKINNGS
jgi:hypothetical protein